MGMYSWDPISGFSTPQPVRTPRLTVRCEYPEIGIPPTEVTFYGILEAHEAHDWFLKMMAENEEFEVETDKPGEWPMPFSSETVRRVLVE